MFYVEQLAPLLVCSVFSGTTPVKNFIFRKNWVGSEVAGMKIAFFVIFDPTWTHILAPKGPNMKFFKQNFNVQSLKKTEAILISFM